jgi:hypothetical protein
MLLSSNNSAFTAQARMPPHCGLIERVKYAAYSTVRCQAVNGGVVYIHHHKRAAKTCETKVSSTEVVVV